LQIPQLFPATRRFDFYAGFPRLNAREGYKAALPGKPAVAPRCDGLKGGTADRSFTYALAVYSTSFQGYQANFADTIGGLQVTRLINAGSKLVFTARQTRDSALTLGPITGRQVVQDLS